MYGFDLHLEDEISMVEFDLPEEHTYDHHESANIQRLYWQQGAFNAIARCSNLFDNCPCH
jgi:hypothetical protein